MAIDAGVDFVTVDGAQGGTGGGKEVTINNTGIPLVYAIGRANNHLVERGVRERISLLVTGGLRDAGDFLKAMALGADAVYIGESALLAMLFHQLDKMPPLTNPSQMFLYSGEYADELDVDLAAASGQLHQGVDGRDPVAGANVGKGRHPQRQHGRHGRLSRKSRRSPRATGISRPSIESRPEAPH